MLDPNRSQSVSVLLIRLWALNRFDLIISEAILSELARVFALPYFTARFTSGYAQQALGLLRDGAQLVEPVADVHGFAPHASDDLILGTAVAGHADYLVTGDYPLRRLGTFRGIQLVRPLAFLDLLRTDDPGGPLPIL